MNKLLLILLTLLLHFTAFAQSDKEKEDKEPQIILHEPEYNFGDIQQGEIVEHVFTIENIGTQPLFISDVTSTCGCVMIESPRKPVTKGKTATIIVRFDSSEKIGPQNKVITIESNALNAEERIMLRGNVLPKNSTP